MAFRGNTCGDWAHLEKKWMRLRTYIKIHQEVLFSEHGDSFASIKQRRLSGDGVWILAMASQHMDKVVGDMVAKMVPSCLLWEPVEYGIQGRGSYLIFVSCQDLVQRIENKAKNGGSLGLVGGSFEARKWLGEWLGCAIQSSIFWNDTWHYTIGGSAVPGAGNPRNGSRRQLMPMMRR
ncbi:hypothetical protein Tco_0576549 [Tanacetum coccineum]